MSTQASQSKPSKKSMSSKISVSIVEDNVAIRENVSTYISFSDDITVSNSYGSIESYLDDIIRNPNVVTDILLLDIGLPGKSGLEGLPLILEKQPNLDIVMLTTYEEEDIILKALCLGAVGYISKKSSLAEICEALRIVSNGGSYMSPLIAREIFKHFANSSSTLNPKARVKSNMLSPRQLDILEKLVDGMSYKSIGAELHISVETVKSHIKKLYKVLHVHNKAEAISKYLKGDFS